MTAFVLLAFGLMLPATTDTASLLPGTAAINAADVCVPGQADCASCPDGVSCGPDLTSVAQCGDGVCAPGQEDCGNCPSDCPCGPGETCVNHQCEEAPSVCGDGHCTPDLEDCGNCPRDCPCGAGERCVNHQCQDAPPACGDGICAPGQEDCGNCPNDCQCATALACVAHKCQCGDGVCAPGEEDCGNCPGDCPCASSEKCVNHQCQEAPSICGDGDCTPDLEDCGNCPNDCQCATALACVAHKCQCGDGVCAPGEEDCGNCPGDCPCDADQLCVNHQCQDAPAACGDGHCTSGREDCGTCPLDCTCEVNLGCIENRCQPMSGCGDGRCEPGVEDCGVCPWDCPCPVGVDCVDRQCKRPLDCGDGWCEPGLEDCGKCSEDCHCEAGTGCSAGQCVLPQCAQAHCAAGCAFKPTFSVSTLRPNANEPIRFSAGLEFIDDPSPKWDMGDGVHLEGTTVVYAYPTPGSYNVILTAREKNCLTDQLSNPVTIEVSNCGDRQCDEEEQGRCIADCGRCHQDCVFVGDERVCTWNCVPVDGASVADSLFPVSLDCGATCEASVTMSNTGSTTWSAAEGYVLVAVSDSDPFTQERSIPLAPGTVVDPLGTYTFQFPLSGPDGTGSGTTAWKMVHGSTLFGEAVQRNVTFSSATCADDGGGGGGEEAPLAGCDNQICQPFSGEGLPSTQVHIFYYAWYGPGRKHWDQNGHRGSGDDIASNFYPSIGPYDSDDDGVVREQLRQIRDAGVGVVVLSWWGPGSQEDRKARDILNIAESLDLKVAWHIEPYPVRSADDPVSRTPDTVVKDIQYIKEQYGKRKGDGFEYPALFRHNGMPVFYIFDSHCIPTPDDIRRNTPRVAICGFNEAHGAKSWDPLDAVKDSNVILAQTTDADLVDKFAGIYTYDVINGPKHFSTGKSIQNKTSKIFSASVGPGYDDRRAVTDGPGCMTDMGKKGTDCENSGRGVGCNYDKEWRMALKVEPTWYSITSFNEWHEGSQIEPAMSTPPTGDYSTYKGAYNYSDDDAPNAYIDRTRHWVERLLGKQCDDPLTNTDVGRNVQVRPIDSTTGTVPLTITFGSVTAQGTMRLTTSSSGPTPPPGFAHGSPAIYYSLSSSATSSGSITLCVNYRGVAFNDESQLRLFQHQDSLWRNVTTSRSAADDVVCGSVSSLSVFAVFQPMDSVPTAQAGPDQTVLAGSASAVAVTLDGSGSSDPDGDTLAFQWRDEAGAVLATSAVATVSLSAGVHRLTLTVSDSRGNSGTDEMVVTVVANRPPVVTGGKDVEAGDANLLASFSDPNGDNMSCSWSGTCTPLQGCAPFTGTGGTNPRCRVRIPFRKTYCQKILKCTDPFGASGSTKWNLSY